MINGVINIYKPQNITSNYVVIRIKKLLNIKGRSAPKWPL